MFPMMLYEVRRTLDEIHGTTPIRRINWAGQFISESKCRLGTDKDRRGVKNRIRKRRAKKGYRYRYRTRS